MLDSLFFLLIINELYRKINNNNSIRDNPTTGFIQFRTHQAGIVARNRCCDLDQAGLSTKYRSDRLWVKLKKLTQLNHSKPNVSDIVSLL